MYLLPAAAASPHPLDTSDVMRTGEAIAVHGAGRVRAQLAARRWQRPVRGVVVTHNGSLTVQQRLRVAVCAGPPGTVLGGLSAADLDGLTGFETPDTSVVLPTGARRPPVPWIVPHWSTMLGPSDVHPLRTPPRTRPARSLVDAASWQSNERRARVIALAGVQQQLATTRQLRDALGRRGPCRHRALLVESILDAAGGISSLPELDVELIRRRFGLPEPSRQSPVSRTDGRYYLDLEWRAFGPRWRSTASRTCAYLSGTPTSTPEAGGVVARIPKNAGKRPTTARTVPPVTDAMRSTKVLVSTVVLAAGLAAPALSAPVLGTRADAAGPSGRSTTTAQATTTQVTTATTANSTGDRNVAVTRWSNTTALRRGSSDGVAVRDGELRLHRVTGHRAYRDPFGSGGTKDYDTASWTSPWDKPGFGLTQMVASWDATTRPGTWIEVQGRGRTAGGRTGSWDVLGRWAGHDAGFHRTSVPGQGDDLSDVAVDTVRMNGSARYAAWQLKVTLLRPHGSERSPRVQSIGAMASAVPAGTPPTSRTTMRRTVDIAVPRYSQMIHQGEYPQYDNGGEAWCSPTSMAMLLAHWKAGPDPREYAWVDDSYAQPWVDFAARNTFDYSYDGTGNWPFSTAYAGKQGLDSFVTRLRSLREAERFIRAGIPLAVSIAYGPGELDGSPIGSTAGHLLVVRGFTADGDVITNDPAAAGADGVRRVYARGQFERAWLPTSGGLTYVVHPEGVPLPRRTAQSNW